MAYQISLAPNGAEEGLMVIETVAFSYCLFPFCQTPASM